MSVLDGPLAQRTPHRPPVVTLADGTRGVRAAESDLRGDDGLLPARTRVAWRDQHGLHTGRVAFGVRCTDGVVRYALRRCCGPVTDSVSEAALIVLDDQH